MSEAKGKSSDIDVDFEQTLKCNICFDIIIRATSLAPCMHTFCGKCISEWHSRAHPNCPTCNQFTERAHKNHSLDYQVELFLKKHPERARSNEEMIEWVAKNTIKCDVPLFDQLNIHDEIIGKIEFKL